ncbi:MAG: hypothetical protein JXQ67_05400 [Campylobacterales bacterium]|nr:hypothetical protein [Campylobacterales bacterium]
MIISLYLVSALNAGEFRELYKISLQKDEQKKFLVKYGNYERLLQFRWTLYTNEGLVVFRSYDRAVAQNILYLGATNAMFRVMLKSQGANTFNTPYVLVKFTKFDYETNRAEFEVMLFDAKMLVQLQELKK